MSLQYTLSTTQGMLSDTPKLLPEVFDASGTSLGSKYRVTMILPEIGEITFAADTDPGLEVGALTDVPTALNKTAGDVVTLGTYYTDPELVRAKLAFA